MLSSTTRLGLTEEEAAAARKGLGREPNDTEWAIISAEWSEHSSYKSSRALLRRLPTTGKRVLLGPGYDAGVVDVGGGYAVTMHIESHNHPSAVDPYGGAATGIGGVLRDILSVGSRPIALLDILRFGDPAGSGHSRWLFRNVVRGISDYGNSTGIPTVAGDIEFDESFERNCLVDVACVGLLKKGGLILGAAEEPGDRILLIGGSTGRDGVGGAAFASKSLSDTSASERSSVQVPDPFVKKLLIDAIAEVLDGGKIHAMKDLGGGGLSTALSEVASKGGSGIDVELRRVNVRESDMAPLEIMTSESQERMILILEPSDVRRVTGVLDKYEVTWRDIGEVTDDGLMKIRWGSAVVAQLPARLVAGAPLMARAARRPAYLSRRASSPTRHPDLARSLVALLGSPNVASRRWVYEQYDHEVGLRTAIRPGEADASLLKLPNGAMLAVKADGNSLHSYLSPRDGAAGCVAEACRNVVAVGAEPIALVDHLQFGDPSDPEVYWTFAETIDGMAAYCGALPIPVVGGKVSFYNEDASTGRAVKPSPVAMVVGLRSKDSPLVSSSLHEQGDSFFVVGRTEREMGGSEYHVRVMRSWSGSVPRPDAPADSATHSAVLKLVDGGLVSAVHDCSKGGLGVAVSEMAIGGGVGVSMELSAVPGSGLGAAELMFSESHGRFIISTGDPDKVSRVLKSSGVAFARVGSTKGEDIAFTERGRTVCKVSVDRARGAWGSAMERLMS